MDSSRFFPLCELANLSVILKIGRGKYFHLSIEQRNAQAFFISSACVHANFSNLNTSFSVDHMLLFMDGCGS